MYYFVRFYEIDEEQWDDRNLIDEDVFEATDREIAKKYCINTYGNHPFARSKKDNRYFYLTDSSLYWYEYHHKKIDIKCDYCGKETQILQKNRIHNKFGEYCSRDCMEKHYDELVNTIENENLWISETDHLGIPKDNDYNLIGYIYKITNKNTLKCYIGKTIKPPLFRWWQHLKVDNKFERANISDLVFEVLEIVTYDEKIEKNKYQSGGEKLSRREAYYIHLFDCLEEGYNIKNEIEKIEE
jgi:uncharacterized protein YneR